ncbi:MAG: hypothetical protein LBS76_01795 [Mycoplasmataceae bacterium]|nr:hypothetical protein [Mycoplasmataceae bacterium]
MSYNKEKKMKITYMDTEVAKQGTEMHYVDLKPNSKKRKIAGMPKWFKVWSETVLESRFNKIETILADHGKRISNLENSK